MGKVTALHKFHGGKETALEPEELTDAQIRIIALWVYETIYGSRSSSQLSKFISPHIIKQIEVQRALRTERATIYKRRLRVVPIPGRVTRSQISAQKIYCVVVLHTTGRSYPLTMCFEFFRFGWRATEVNLM